MKRNRKILAIALALFMLLSLSACGISDLPLIKAGLNFAQLNSVHIDVDGELGVSVSIPAYSMDMNFSFTADGGVDYCADPLQFAADLRINAMDEDLHLLAYGEDRNGDFVISYSADDGLTWEEKTVGKTSDITSSMDKTSDLSLSDIIDLGKNLGESFSGFSKAGQEHVNGRSATRYNASFSLAKVLNSEAAQEAFYSGLESSMNIDAEALAGMIDVNALEDLQLSLWLDDAESRIVKVQIDMTDLMKSLMASGLMDSLLASSAGLDGIDFAADVSALRLALTFSNFDSVGRIERPDGSGSTAPAPEPSAAPAPADAALQPGDTWRGQITISNHAGQGTIQNGTVEVWGVIGTASGQDYFELYHAEDAGSTSASPILSFWAEIGEKRIVPVIDPAAQDGWLMNIYLDDAAESELIFTLEDGVLSASYFYYDADTREACDVAFALTREA